MESIGATKQGAGPTVIGPPKAWPRPNVREVVENRDLLYYLARRDVVIRYKQAIVGILWAVFQPLVLAAVFTLFLGKYAGLEPPEGIPYGLFAVSGLVMWLFFADALTDSSKSTLDNDTLISRIYFPRTVLPIAALAPGLVNFLCGFVVVVIVSCLYGLYPDARILAVPLVVLLGACTALGPGLWLSALNVKYRDVTLVVPTLLLVGLFITPISYPADLVPATLKPLYAINPMVGVVEAFRWSVFGADWPGTLLLIPIGTSLVSLVSGAFFFKRSEQSFADFI